MSGRQRASAHGIRTGRAATHGAGQEFRNQRLSLGLTQAAVAGPGGLSRSRYAEIEGGRTDTMTIVEFCRIASVLGLDPVVRLYPGGRPLRDNAHAERLGRFLAHASPPLVHRREVPLPAVEGRLERRAWDADIRGSGERTTIELEMRLHDAQAQERRIALKRRDDPADHFVLLVADTRTNRTVLSEHPRLFGDLPHLRPSRVVAALQAGRHPGTGLMFV